MIKTLLLISDFLFPIWFVVLMIVLKKKDISTWKAWGIASTFCLVQAYLVAKVVGWNLGGYVIIFISSLPSILFGKEIVSESITLILFWIIPPLVFVIFPTLALFLLQKHKAG